VFLYFLLLINLVAAWSVRHTTHDSLRVRNFSPMTQRCQILFLPFWGPSLSNNRQYFCGHFTLYTFYLNIFERNTIVFEYLRMVSASNNLVYQLSETMMHTRLQEPLHWCINERSCQLYLTSCHIWYNVECILIYPLKANVCVGTYFIFALYFSNCLINPALVTTEV
jgi:hypothetical protein